MEMIKKYIPFIFILLALSLFFLSSKGKDKKLVHLEEKNKELIDSLNNLRDRIEILKVNIDSITKASEKHKDSIKIIEKDKIIKIKEIQKYELHELQNYFDSNYSF